jgi:hypothetical protein
MPCNREVAVLHIRIGVRALAQLRNSTFALSSRSIDISCRPLKPLAPGCPGYLKIIAPLAASANLSPATFPQAVLERDGC